MVKLRGSEVWLGWLTVLLCTIPAVATAGQPQSEAIQKHWSFIAPRKAPLPPVANQHWPQNAIDRFVLSRLERENLLPSRQANPSILLRRLTLDLTGLPPTLAEIEQFQRQAADDLDAAYRHAVDRLLASPRFGERMTLGWLDAARYADTNGYFTDKDRTMWRWRDWVIDAFNQGMPFDQFSIQQLAGDMLPGATLAERTATGFNRNHMVNNETGIIEEEFRIEYVVDRVDTTATVWLGLTVACARCHDHKYDPISQRDFYRFFSFFNNVPERGLSGSSGNSAPFLRVPTAEQLAELARLRRVVSDAEREFAAAARQIEIAQARWEKTVAQRAPETHSNALVARYALESTGLSGAAVGPVESVPGIVGFAAKLSGDAWIRPSQSVGFERNEPFSYGAWIYPSGAGCIVSKTDDANDLRGFDVTLRKGKAVANLVHRWNSDAIQVTTRTGVQSGQWQHLMVTYDGSGKAAGLKIYLDGRPQPVEVGRDNLTGTIRNGEPVRIGRRQASASFKGMIDDVRIYRDALTGKQIFELVTSQYVRGILARSEQRRTAVEKRKLRDFFLEEDADPELAAAAMRLEALRAREAELVNNLPTTMVMQEAPQPRGAHVLVRGQYDQPGVKVTSGVPAFLDPRRRRRPTPVELRPDDRLALAKWLFQPEQPLTARVTANRLWHQFFGTGIVKSVDDFGIQGDRPSHPELLDWLAIELVDSGWQVQHLIRLIVTSASYRQCSDVTPELLRRDRENRLLARGPRFRMDAEMLRDNALAISGLLSERLGGPSVKPYQPSGLWREVTYDGELGYEQDHGESLYRRSLYTFWKRQSPPPSMLSFDAPTRETCTVQRYRTNTPLQALVLMNDPTFVEAARKLAERVMTEVAEDDRDRAQFAFRVATARYPSVEELEVILGVFSQQRSEYADDRERALELLSAGESGRDESLENSELAAWTVVASMILCLDETVTRR